MARTEVSGRQVKDGTVQRDDLDVATVGEAVVRKIVQGTGVTISSTGADAGTGDVTINATGGSGGTLTEQAAPAAVSGASVQFANQGLGRVSARDHRGGDAMIDYRRKSGLELFKLRGDLANRFKKPANVYMLGDSFTEGAGASAYNNTYVDIFRESLQDEYRPGGGGFFPLVISNNQSYPNPFTNAGTPSTTDFGAGFGRRSIFMDTTDDISTITAYCDKFRVIYYGNVGGGTFKVTVDGVVAGTQSTATTFPMGGRIWESPQLPLGYHTIAITPNAASNSVFIEGIQLFATDGPTGVFAGGCGTGVHVYAGGHATYQAANFNGDTGEDGTSVGARRAWPLMMFQPFNVVDSGAANVTANGTTTLVWTGTSPAFTSDDIGEVVYGGVNTAFPRGVRIVSITSATTVVVNKVVPAASYWLAFTRSRVTDAVRNGTGVITSATAAFKANDVGKTVSGTGIPAGGCTIRQVDSATQIQVFPAATSSGSGGTLQIKNRQSNKHTRPSMLSMQFQGNEMFAGIPKAEFKANMQAIYDTMVDAAQLDVPTMTGIYNDERPSVNMITDWANINTVDATFTAAYSIGSNIISTPVSGTIREPRFTAADIGKVLHAGGIEGFTITAMSGSPTADGWYTAAVMSSVALAATTNGAVTLSARNWQEVHWLPYRAAEFELANDNLWSQVDIYALSGFIPASDPKSLFWTDNVHPNDAGHQWVADELASAFGGAKRTRQVSQGLIDNPGEMFIGESADKVKKVPGILHAATNVSTGSTVGSFQPLTDLQFRIGANEWLRFDFMLYVIAAVAAATSGLVFRLNKADVGVAMSTPANLVMTGHLPASASTYTDVGIVAPTTWPQPSLTGTGSSGSTTLPSLYHISGTMKAGAAGGLVIPEIGPEVAAVMTVLAGSHVTIL